MDWLASPPYMNPIEHVYDCLQKRIVANLCSMWDAEKSVGRRWGHDLSCGHPEVDLQLPVTLHGSYTDP